MIKFRIIYFGLFFTIITLSFFVFFRLKSINDFHQKAVLAVETRKALEHLMVDLSRAKGSTIRGVPADGQWYHQLAFESAGQGVLQYTIHDGHLWRINNQQALLVADDMGDLRIRRGQQTPDIIEVQIKAHKNLSLISNIKIRVSS